MGVKISMAYLLKQQKDGKIKGFSQTSVAPVLATGKQGWKTKGVRHIREVLERNNVAYEAEYRFDKVRKFRLDFVIHARMAAFEYEGISSRKSRHTTKTGFSNDALKYNLAQMQGWKVFRYTSKTLTQFEKDLIQILNGKAD